MVVPKLAYESIGRDRRVRVQEQDRKDGALLLWADRYDAVVAGDLEQSEQPEEQVVPPIESKRSRGAGSLPR
jgi:hypothetical protein